MEVLIKLLFLFGGASFLLWWFLKGLLNPFIEAAVAIVMTAVVTIAGFFLDPVIAITRAILRPIRRILTPVWVKIPVYLILGAGIFVLDHYYNTKVFAEDETTFYRLVIADRVFWVTSIAFWSGSFLLLLSAWYILKVILRGLNRLLDRPIHISVIVQK